MASASLIVVDEADVIIVGHIRAKPLSTYRPRSRIETKGRSPTARGYDYRWRKARLDFLRRNPLCVQCKKQGYVVAASIVDHVVPHRGDQVLFWDEDNWAAMCAGCHSRKTAKRDGGFGNRRNK